MHDSTYMIEDRWMINGYLANLDIYLQQIERAK